MKVKKKNNQRFVAHVKEALAAEGCELYASKGKTVLCDGVKCSGYFCGDVKRLAIATNRNEQYMVGILAHEFGHFNQWREQSDIWTADTMNENDFKRLITPEKRLTPTLKRKLSCLRELEADCERRAIKLIKKFDLKIDIRKYAQNANAYIYFYTFIEEYRRWYPSGQGPWSVRKIVNAMPTSIIRKHDVIPHKIRQLYINQYMES